MNNPKNIKIHTDLAQKLVKLGVFEEFLQACNEDKHQIQHAKICSVHDGFTWGASKQGHEYWRKVAVKCGENI